MSHWRTERAHPTVRCGRESIGRRIGVAEAPGSHDVRQTITIATLDDRVAGLTAPLPI